MTNYTDEIRARLDAMSEGEIERLAGVLEWREDGSPHRWAATPGPFLCDITALPRQPVLFRFRIWWMVGPPVMSEVLSPRHKLIHAKAALAIFLALVRRDLPEIDLPYCEGVDCEE